MRGPLLLALAAALCAAGPLAAAPGRLADEPLQGAEWWLHDIGADQVVPPGPGVPIVIVDSGVDPTHPEFSARPGTTFLNAQTVTGLEEWHGTEVASLAAAPANGAGILGVYPQAALDVWDASPTPGVSQFAAAAGIEAAAQHCPAVINLSFGSGENSPEVERAVVTAVHNGCLVVAAVGNAGGTAQATFPAAYPHVLAVGASDENDHVALFSSVAPWVGLVAPGVDLVAAVPLSRDPSGYASGQKGTSFSTSLVSAAAAWIWTARPTLDASQVTELLRRTARDGGTPGHDSAYGWGLLDIPAALAAPAPPRSPEPNEDIDQVKPGQLFPDGQPPLTTAARPANRIAGSIAPYADPRDLYRIWVPAHRIVRVSITGAGVAARIWGPQTVSVTEGAAGRRRDLKGTSVRAVGTGFAAYVEVLLAGHAALAPYVLGVQSSRR